ncbi:unnamed protein product (macronuclear) [Paramecium tetraurelia]|uniref:U2A'/phosphoprotein 32 family A C-terminal domain-containing protein n=1 Tax=Paramecium tetraurelia TaxID=5888 RepID=A0DB59_PARTE|nr:uncharacterized protein GSPATT00015170001 [Paramecium tetraurelia]CAK80276.1 unnamed protein product [Paramecium tetraurelia]|eukprot:XP_001447673.1 hypothetical protein (macronuclear) [Paramecium tetraurelia strain d4-2]
MAATLDQIKKEIIAQQEAQNGELEDLDIEGIAIGQFDNQSANLIQQHQNLISLSLVECQLKNLEGFPKLNNLENLILESNQLDGTAISYISKNFKKLACLSLADNKIQKFEDVEPLKQLKQLQQLDLADNPITHLPGYFNKIFELIPSLSVLDNKDKDGQEIEISSGEDEGDESDLGGKVGDEDDEDEFDEDEDDEDDESDVKPVKKTKK